MEKMSISSNSLKPNFHNSEATFLTVSLVIALFGMCGADVCYMGQQPDPSDGEMRWVLPYSKDIRCQCTKILFGGKNMVAPPGAEEFFYTDTPLLFVNNHNTNELRALLECKASQDVTDHSTDEVATISSQDDQEKSTAGQLTTEEREITMTTNRSEQDQENTTVGLLTAEEDKVATNRFEQDQEKTTVGQLTSQKDDIATRRSKQDQEKATIGQLTTEEDKVATNRSEPDQEKTTVGLLTQLTTEKDHVATRRSEQDQEKATVGQLTTEEDKVATNRFEQDQEKTTVGQLSTENDHAATRRSDKDQETTTIGQLTAGNECMNPLGMKSHDIPDSAITASSNRGDNLPSYGRLDDNRTWVSHKDDNATWIQIDLGSQKNVYGLITQGYKSNDNTTYWVGKVKVQWGVTSLSYIHDTDGHIKVFDANVFGGSDDGYRDDYAIIQFPYVFVTKIIRIEPSECFKNQKSAKNCVLRLEVLGCEL